mmetsp:Transcript_12878/g.34909  ORF Transcript_12878/g.34909 Transcript_12878/m.34909 type:complete len:530 (-) Transcript_12878:101-1690(-)
MAAGGTDFEAQFNNIISANLRGTSESLVAFCKAQVEAARREERAKLLAEGLVTVADPGCSGVWTRGFYDDKLEGRCPACCEPKVGKSMSMSMGVMDVRSVLSGKGFDAQLTGDLRNNFYEEVLANAWAIKDSIHRAVATGTEAPRQREVRTCDLQSIIKKANLLWQDRLLADSDSDEDAPQKKVSSRTNGCADTAAPSRPSRPFAIGGRRSSKTQSSAVGDGRFLARPSTDLEASIRKEASTPAGPTTSRPSSAGRPVSARVSENVLRVPSVIVTAPQPQPARLSLPSALHTAHSTLGSHAPVTAPVSYSAPEPVDWRRPEPPRPLPREPRTEATSPRGDYGGHGLGGGGSYGGATSPQGESEGSALSGGANYGGATSPRGEYGGSGYGGLTSPRGGASNGGLTSPRGEYAGPQVRPLVDFGPPTGGTPTSGRTPLPPTPLLQPRGGTPPGSANFLYSSNVRQPQRGASNPTSPTGRGGGSGPVGAQTNADLIKTLAELTALLQDAQIIGTVASNASTPRGAGTPRRRG